MKKVMIFVCLLLVTNLFSQTKKYTLEESVKLGLENSKIIKISQSNVNYASYKEKEISANFLPKISLEGSYTRLSEVDPFTITVPFSPTPIKVQDAILNNYSISAKLVQPIFTGFKLSSAKNIAELNLAAAEIVNADEANKIALNVKNVFLNFYKIKQNKFLLEERLASIKNHISDSKKYLENGLITKNELLKIQVLESEVNLQLIEIENSYTIIQSRFNQLLGLNLNAKSDVLFMPENQDEDLVPFEKLLDEALKSRAELKSLELKTEVASHNITSSKSDFYPQVNLFASYNYENPNQRIMPLEDKFNDTWSAGVSFKWNIWNWGESSAKVQQAKEKYNQAQIEKSILKEQIEIDVYKKYLKVISENKKVKLAELKLVQTKENYRIVEKKYKEHLVSSTELSDAEVDLMNSKIEKTNAEVDYLIAVEELNKSLGRKIY